MLFAVAWRNLWRHKRRSLITAAAMSLGLALCMSMIAFSDGMYVKMFEVMVEQQLGHVQVHHEKYPVSREIYDTVSDAGTKLEAIEALDSTVAVTERLFGYALVGSEKTSAGVQLQGILPSHEAEVTRLDTKVKAGQWLTDEPTQSILLGHKLAEELEVGIGDAVVAVTQAADGSMGNALYTVTGLVKSGSSQMDRSGAWLHLTDLQDLLVLPEQVHEMTLVSTLSDDTSAYKAQVEAAIGGEENLLVRTWQEASPQTQQLLSMQDVGALIMLGIVFLVAAFGIINTMLMSVYERTTELGVLKALGFKPRQLVAMIVIEAGLLAFLACVGGLALGGLLDWYLVVYGFDFSAAGEEGLSFAGVTLDPVMYGAVRPKGILMSIAAVFIVSVLAALWPAFRASRLNPVDAIRAE